MTTENTSEIFRGLFDNSDPTEAAHATAARKFLAKKAETMGIENPTTESGRNNQASIAPDDYLQRGGARVSPRLQPFVDAYDGFDPKYCRPSRMGY